MRAGDPCSGRGVLARHPLLGAGLPLYGACPGARLTAEPAFALRLFYLESAVVKLRNRHGKKHPDFWFLLKNWKVRQH